METNDESEKDTDLSNPANMQAYLGVVAARLGIPQRWYEDFVQEGCVNALEYMAAGHNPKTALVYGVRAARRALGRWLSEEPASGNGPLSPTRRKVKINNNLKPGLELWFSQNAASRRVNRGDL